MSKFFKALEQAELDRRAMRGEAEAPAPAGRGRVPQRGDDVPTGVVGEAVPARERDKPVPRRRVLEVERREAPDLVEEPRSADRSGSERSGIEQHLVSLLAPVSFEAEQYRVLRHVIEHLHNEASLTVLAVSSPAVGDGKTTTVLNLAGALAQDPRARVLVVDVDLRRPTLAESLGVRIASGRGLVDAIQDPKLTLDDVIVRCASFSLAVLPAGRPPDAPFELLKSARFEELLTEARRRYDYVVLDTPPLVPVPDCRVIERCVDGVLIVVGAHRTQRRLVEESLAIVDPGKIIGLLFNGDDQALSGSYSGYYARGSSENGHTGGWLARTVRTARRHVDGAH